AVRDHFLELLAQHFLADVANEPPQLAEAQPLAGDIEQNQQLPLSADQIDHSLHATAEWRFRHRTHLRNHTYQMVRSGSLATVLTPSPPSMSASGGGKDMDIGIIGAGTAAQAFARKAVDAGHKIVFSNS